LSSTEKVKIRNLVRLASWILGLWGAAIVPKGLYDIFWGEPEANMYAPQPWAFVSYEQWLRYSGFELSYGISCLALAWFLWRYSCFLPETVTRLRE
jgi:hypothetical protein